MRRFFTLNRLNSTCRTSAYRLSALPSNVQVDTMLALFCCLMLIEDPLVESVRPVEASEPPIASALNDSMRLNYQSERLERERGGSGGMMGNPMGDGGPGYTLRFLPQQAVDGQPTELGFLRQQLQLGVPVYKDDTNMVLLNGGVQNMLFQGSAVFPESGRLMTSQLWSVRMGPGYFRQLGDGWSLGLLSSVNISSDEPFKYSRDVNANVIGFLRIPANDTDSWMFSVMYAPLGEIPFPIPGVAYQWRPSQEWNINLGIPFSISYKPSDCWSFDFNWMPVRTFRLQSGYQLTDSLQLFARWQWTNESWFLSDREDDRERLFYYEMSVMGGLRYQLYDRIFAEFGAGYAFNRYFFNGRNFDDRDNDRIGLAPGLMIQTGINMRF